MTYSYTCPQCQTENEGDFTPERPAPFCQNHDSPAFSDPGEGADWDGPEKCENCGYKFDFDKVIEEASEYCADNFEPDYNEDDPREDR